MATVLREQGIKKEIVSVYLPMIPESSYCYTTQELEPSTRCFAGFSLLAVTPKNQ
jgi:hypothetical protein